MAAAELRAVFEASGHPLTTLSASSRFIDGHADVFDDDLPAIVSRLGLTHVVASHLFDGTPGQWSEGARDCCLPTGIPFAARAVRVDADASWDSAQVEREIGTLLAAGRPVDLRNPRLIARAFLLRDRVFVGREVWNSDPKALRARHVENRPFFSPVSLDPRLARTLVNLSGVAPGQTLLDPFCGTGGVLIEAAHMGVRAFGSDLDPDMVAGTRRNLEHFGVSGTVAPSDVERVPSLLAGWGLGHVDAVVADLPYGRSASTGKEAIRDLYARAMATIERVLRPGGSAVLGLPDRASVDAAAGHLELVDVFPIRAHRSLTRHFARLRKVATV